MCIYVYIYVYNRVCSSCYVVQDVYAVAKTAMRAPLSSWRWRKRCERRNDFTGSLLESVWEVFCEVLPETGYNHQVTKLIDL